LYSLMLARRSYMLVFQMSTIKTFCIYRNSEYSDSAKAFIELYKKADLLLRISYAYFILIEFVSNKI
ncbi:hypothetical protein NAI69_10085, partial [Francisella tularensis subsp. holarctica]|nr:hypothetical protein [Francisella tularensis subsp. holarctica]